MVSTATAQDNDVRIFALAVGDREGTTDQKRRWAQFSDLASRTGGECFEIGKADEVVRRVHSLLMTETAVVALTDSAIEGVRQGKKLEEIASEKGVDVREVTNIMHLLRRRGMDESRLRPNEPVFTTGWILAEFKGTPMIEREVLMSRSELDLTLSALSTFSSAMGADLVGGVKAIALDPRANPFADFFRDESSRQRFDIFLRVRQLPVGRDSMLRLTRDEILGMGEEKRAELREKIARLYTPRLVNWRNDDRVWRRRGADDFTWCPENFLP